MVGLLPASATVVVLAVTDSWRAALLATVASAAVLATGVRFASRLAWCVLAAAAALALGGHAISADERAASRPRHDAATEHGRTQHRGKAQRHGAAHDQGRRRDGS